MSNKRTIKLIIKLPKGVFATPEMEAKAIDAANSAIKSFTSNIQAARNTAAELLKKGFLISAEELLARRTIDKSKTAKSKATIGNNKTIRKRVVLSNQQKDEITEALQNGATANSLATKYGCSSATIHLLKKERGLTKSRDKLTNES
jgi:hypothetical protein